MSAGTLVHYPTVADPLKPLWEDDHGSISGPSANKGFEVYIDQACARAYAMHASMLACYSSITHDGKHCGRT